MDAAKTTLKNIALLLAVSLLFLTSWSAKADTPVAITTCGSVSFSGIGTQCNIATTGGTFSYTTSIAYNDSTTGWLGINPGSGTVSQSG
ncbi:MAG TPA: hypothetical protein VG456_01045, partial [Candidatus Sulfopaludibacter sp.]|nr:hypothetical protein [Candidatus Sulfopaludibacter sp.]